MASWAICAQMEVWSNPRSDDSVKPFIVDLWCGRAVTLLLDTEGVLYSFGVALKYCP